MADDVSPARFAHSPRPTAVGSPSPAFRDNTYWVATLSGVIAVVRWRNVLARERNMNGSHFFSSLKFM
jgi:hypothetical protein